MNRLYCLEDAWRFREGEGIAARLTSLFQGDTSRIVMAFNLCMTLIGTPVLYYGDEIGMVNDLEFYQKEYARTGIPDGRYAVRGRMNWTTVDQVVDIVGQSHEENEQDFESHDGDSAPSTRQSSPAIPSLTEIPQLDPFALDDLESADPSLARAVRLFHAISLMTHERFHHKCFGRGNLTFLPSQETSPVLAFVRTFQYDEVIVVCNLSDSQCTYKLPDAPELAFVHASSAGSFSQLAADGEEHLPMYDLLGYPIETMDGKRTCRELRLDGWEFVWIACQYVQLKQ